jgi:hypothetical protein
VWQETACPPSPASVLWKTRNGGQTLAPIWGNRNGQLFFQWEAEEFFDVSLNLLQQSFIHTMVHKLQISD